jgi:hypothetical protein
MVIDMIGRVLVRLVALRVAFDRYPEYSSLDPVDSIASEIQKQVLDHPSALSLPPPFHLWTCF